MILLVSQNIICWPKICLKVPSINNVGNWEGGGSGKKLVKIANVVYGLSLTCPTTAKVSVSFEQNILLITSTLHEGNYIFLRELRKNFFINVSKNSILFLQTISTPMLHRRKCTCLLLSNKVRLSAYVELVVFSGVSNAAADTIFHLVIIRTAKCNRPPLVFSRP